MTEQFAHPPIVEAIVIIDIALMDVSISELSAAISNKINGQYPKVTPVMHVGISVKSSAENPDVPVIEHSSASEAGCDYRSEDGLDSVRVTPNQILVSRLEPYNGGDDLMSKFLIICDVLRNSFDKRIYIHAIHLRYINKFPYRGEKGIRYWENAPKLLNLPARGSVDGVFMKFYVDSPIHDAKAVVNVWRKFDELTGKISDQLVFDIDAFKQLGEQIDFESVYNDLREFKNEIFTKNITVEAKGHFNE